MIRIELKPVCMDCDHAAVEVEEEGFCGFAAGRHSTVVRCAHAAVCGAASACQRPANGAGGDGGPGGGEPPRRRPMTGPFALGM